MSWENAKWPIVAEKVLRGPQADWTVELSEDPSENMTGPPWTLRKKIKPKRDLH